MAGGGTAPGLRPRMRRRGRSCVGVLAGAGERAAGGERGSVRGKAGGSGVRRGREPREPRERSLVLGGRSGIGIGDLRESLGGGRGSLRWRGRGRSEAGCSH